MYACCRMFQLSLNPPASCSRRGLAVPLFVSGSRTTGASRFTLRNNTLSLCDLVGLLFGGGADLQRKTRKNTMEKAKAFNKMSILFDFDGTIGDTETPAMEVAFWELAPYLVNTRESLSASGLGVWSMYFA